MFPFSVPDVDFRLKWALAEKSIAFSANNTTAEHDLFTLTGVVEVMFYGVVTTTLGANHTAGALVLDDATAEVDISESATGATLSAIAAGSLVYRESAADTALQVHNANVGAVAEPSAGAGAFTPIFLIKKNGATTKVQYQYTTTDTPTSGAMTWFAMWRPVSADGDLTAA